MSDRPDNAFERAQAQGSKGLTGEFVDFLKQNKKYYLIPIVVVLLLMAALVLLGGTAAAPFIYTLF
jgi:hypothetical protein